MLDLSARKVYGALAEQCVGGDAKADKVENATSGHLAGLDSNGNLTDSGVSPTEDVTVEGNPVTFESPFEQDAKSVVVSVKPIQDLHGYDHPWVGGAGKNKLPLTLANLKAWNTEGAWVGNTYTSYGVSFTCYTSDDDAVVRIHAEGTSGSAPGWLSLFKNDTLDIGHATILSGCPAGGGNLSYVLAGYLGNPNRWYEDNGNGVDIPQDVDLEQVYIEIKTGYAIPSGGIDFYPMIRLATESDATFAPYSNICPISGIDEVEIEVSDGESEPTTTTIPLPSTLYGGEVDVTNGIDTVTYGYIASYNGETLPGAWISDRDACTGSNSPTIGAEVAYELATPTTISFTPTDVELLEGTNVMTTNGEKVAVTYGRSLWQDIDELKTATEGKLNKSDVADIEGDTASRPYSVNEFMLRADGFYKVTQPIAQNASITASNTEKTTIGAVLTALLNA